MLIFFFYLSISKRIFFYVKYAKVMLFLSEIPIPEGSSSKRTESGRISPRSNDSKGPRNDGGGPHLTFHRVGIDLAHVGPRVILLNVGYVEFPRVVTVVSHP